MALSSYVLPDRSDWSHLTQTGEGDSGIKVFIISVE